ncbi:HupE/UreJ family protein [Chitinophaga sp.]|uniref:HupE/UreJ family protein n=1 Tax=Chitinophaga sp. TaxID=1869181 RepID=UPI0031D95240
MRYYFLLLICCVGALGAKAHPMPNSIILLDIKSNGVVAEVQLPLSELELALGHKVEPGPALRAYLLAHIHPQSLEGYPWTVQVKDLHIQSAAQTATGPYNEVTATLWMEPVKGTSVRNFSLHYDAIIAEVSSHKALVSVRQDWERGKYGEQSSEVGVIKLDVRSGTIEPLVVSREQGSLWRGFSSMVALGMQHIAAGTDHLLFLLVLLLPAPLLVRQQRWDGYGGTRYSLIRLLQIVTAFTIGHSITLLAGAAGWLRLPSQPVEVLIAVSILVSAVHALRPLFPGREAWVAAGFGLVHGLAFAGTLANLQLDATRMGLSILGFNVGIELMQLIVILFVMPWLIWLSRIPAYKYVRVTGAVLAGITATMWITARI